MVLTQSGFSWQSNSEGKTCLCQADALSNGREMHGSLWSGNSQQRAESPQKEQGGSGSLVGTKSEMPVVTSTWSNGFTLWG